MWLLKCQPRTQHCHRQSLPSQPLTTTPVPFLVYHMKRSRSQRSPKSVRLVESKRRRQPDPSTSYATSINTDVVYRAQGDTRGRSGQEVTQAVGSSLIAHVDLSKKARVTANKQQRRRTIKRRWTMMETFSSTKFLRKVVTQKR